MERVHCPSAAFVQVRLHLPTLAGLEELPQPSVSKADDHRVDERKANATECQLSIYTPASPHSSRRAGGANRTIEAQKNCALRFRLRHAFLGTKETPSRCIEPEWAEAVDAAAAGHGGCADYAETQT